MKTETEQQQGWWDAMTVDQRHGYRRALRAWGAAGCPNGAAGFSAFWFALDAYLDAVDALDVGGDALGVALDAADDARDALAVLCGGRIELALVAAEEVAK